MAVIGVDRLPDEVQQHLAQSQYTLFGIETKGENGYVVYVENPITQESLCLKYYHYAYETHREVRLLARVRSPHILQVQDAACIGNEFAYFLTPYYPLGDLDNAIETGQLSMRDAVEVTKLILDGTAALHDVGLVHRDLKPANMLLSDHKRPIIADFGSVRALDGAYSTASSAHSPLYRPPEGWQHGIYDPRSDLYQVGLVLFQLLGGSLPHDFGAWVPPRRRATYDRLDDYGKSEFVGHQIEARCLSNSLARLDTLPEYVPPPLRRVIRKALSPSPTDRYQTSGQFRAALHNLRLADWKRTALWDQLTGYRGNDYRVLHVGGVWRVAHTRSGRAKWRYDNQMPTGTRAEVYSVLLPNLGCETRESRGLFAVSLSEVGVGLTPQTRRPRLDGCP